MLLRGITSYSTVCRSFVIIPKFSIGPRICTNNPVIKLLSTSKDNEVDEMLKNKPHTTRFKIFLAGRSPIVKGILFVIGMMGATIYGLFILRIYLKRQQLNRLTSSSGQTYGEMAVGGPFDLISTKGERITSESLLGNWLLLYFGFTYCPDICPEQMELLGALADIAESDHGITNLIPVMITIDPDRDTPDVLDEYLEDYNHKILGLTGTNDQLNQVCRAYRVYKSKGQAVDDDNDYILDHSVTQYLINPEGKAVGYFMSNRNLEERIPIFLDHVEKFNNHVNEKVLMRSDSNSWLGWLKNAISVQSG